VAVSFALFQISGAIPADRAVACVALVAFSAERTVDFAGELTFLWARFVFGGFVQSLQNCLRRFKSILVDYGWMRILRVEHRQFACIRALFLLQMVVPISLLKHGIAGVFFVSGNITDTLYTPLAAESTGDATSIQISADNAECISGNNPIEYFMWILDDHFLPLGISENKIERCVHVVSCFR